MNRLTHRLVSLLMILTATVSYIATEGTTIVPPKYHGAVLLASLVLVGLSKSVQEIVKGEAEPAAAGVDVAASMSAKRVTGANG